MTKMIFRKWKEDGSIDAILPEIPGTNDPSSFTVYSHVGQHSSGQAGYYIGRTVPATPEEYKDLLAELISIGYTDLKVVKRMSRKDYDARKEAIDETRI